MALGRYRNLDADGGADQRLRRNEFLRPDVDGSGYGPPIALAPGYCALSMLFSDWDRSGRRDLRISNDRHYYDS